MGEEDDDQQSGEEVANHVDKQSLWGDVSSRDLVNNKTELKGAHLKHIHTNKCPPAGVMGKTLTPFLGYQHSWVPLKCTNVCSIGNKQE